MNTRINNSTHKIVMIKMKESPSLALRKISLSSILTAAIVLSTALDKEYMLIK